MKQRCMPELLMFLMRNTPIGQIMPLAATDIFLPCHGKYISVSIGISGKASSPKTFTFFKEKKLAWFEGLVILLSFKATVSSDC